MKKMMSRVKNKMKNAEMMIGDDSEDDEDDSDVRVTMTTTTTTMTAMTTTAVR